ncbi:hypothetical protein HNQ80_003740 [Anaerosolibacter carboniphilus]|uniref:Molybdopterin cofactor biosynthesis MoaD-related C-terminal domain-containing protein n=1 Tax=Anaerosolibacter carboniphilus TaxID=1417629 RepID=A0A841KW82_9FIRM|nr:hypothetical protein [Anaerosolibacter carboniphilus]MBB6217617.1 hypothetical protein [Anaerosolibacter carboniphilus]
MWEEIIESGMPRAYIEAYLNSLGGSNDEKGLYQGNDWEIQIYEEADRCFGKLCLPANRVHFRGEKSKCMEMVERFRLNFLSAGG